MNEQIIVEAGHPDGAFPTGRRSNNEPFPAEQIEQRRGQHAFMKHAAPAENVAQAAGLSGGRSVEHALMR